MAFLRTSLPETYSWFCVLIMKNSTLAEQLVEIYTLMCRAALNKDYYGILLSRTQSLNMWSDIIVAIGTTGGGISALTIWHTNYGTIIWGVLTAIAAIVALAKPIVQLNKRIERLSRLFIGHSDTYTNLLILVSRIKRRGEFTDEMNSVFEAAELRFLELSKEDDPKPNFRILRLCEEMVRKRHPPEEAWYPEPQKNATPH